MSPGTWGLILFMGYGIGSISPAYILGRLLKKIDIREHGSKNAGAVNTYNVLGFVPSLITAVFDCSKGLTAMFCAHLLGASPLLTHLTGFAAILGHVFPFYLNFRGGQGVATATAIMVYYLVIFLTRGWIPPEAILILAFSVLSFSYIAKKGELVGMIILPLLAVFAVVFAPQGPYLFFLLSAVSYVFFIQMLNIRKNQMLPLSTEKAKAEINWRLYARPFAVFFLFNYLKTSKREALTLIGVVVLFFLILDLIRLFSKTVNIFLFRNVQSLFKSKEYQKFSSITLFLVGSFLTILLFEKAIAFLAVSFLIFGDLFGKFFGILFGRKKIFDKTFEGSLAHFNGCLISGYVFLHFVSFPVPLFLLGVFVASVAESLPLGVNDNFSVPILSASAMEVFHLF